MLLNIRTLRVTCTNEVAEGAVRLADELAASGNLPPVGDGVNELGALLAHVVRIGEIKSVTIGSPSRGGGHGRDALATEDGEVESD